MHKSTFTLFLGLTCWKLEIGSWNIFFFTLWGAAVFLWKTSWKKIRHFNQSKQMSTCRPQSFPKNVCPSIILESGGQQISLPAFSFPSLILGNFSSNYSKAVPFLFKGFTKIFLSHNFMWSNDNEKESLVVWQPKFVGITYPLLLPHYLSPCVK